MDLLDASPTDIEAWTELSDLYLTQGMFTQAIFCLEEVLLVAPNAWNVCHSHCTAVILLESQAMLTPVPRQIHARLGEVLFISATASSAGNDASVDKILSEATRRFCRSIELCEGYLRGYYGLKMVNL